MRGPEGLVPACGWLVEGMDDLAYPVDRGPAHVDEGAHEADPLDVALVVGGAGGPWARVVSGFVPTSHTHDGELAVVLIGMRVNHPWRPDLWGPVFAAMPGMISEL